METNSTNSSSSFKIAVWGSFPESQACPISDYLWHDKVPSLPELGSVIKIDDTKFQVEGVRRDDLWRVLHSFGEPEKGMLHLLSSGSYREALCE